MKDKILTVKCTCGAELSDRYHDVQTYQAAHLALKHAAKRHAQGCKGSIVFLGEPT